jgi:predicted ATPase/class 3 adenylate cyclase
MFTFLFTDIADSTALWQQYPKEMSTALADHDSILHQIIPTFDGAIVKSTGDGILAVFDGPLAATQAAIALQKSLLRHAWGATGPLRVRMGIHTGEAEPRDGDYYGTTVNKAARVMSLASGEQILLSDTSAALLNDNAQEAFRFQDLGKYRLKGLAGQTGIQQLEHPDLPNKFPALKGGLEIQTNLPEDLTSFIGRESDIEQLHDLLVDFEEQQPVARLITLIGPGGTGKTRLALKVAREVRAAFPDGVWLIELAPITDPAGVPNLLMETLGLPGNPNQDPQDLLAKFLQNRQALLILDNCEHLLDTSARLVQKILGQAPLIRVLASSREALGVPGEHVFSVPSLQVPSEAQDWEIVRESEAVRLFTARAQAVGAAHWIRSENGETIAQICRRLDGIALAIELAAARLRAFSPAQILQRLDDRFRLLTGGSRTALPRHQTLGALIDWSYDLLSPEEKGLLQEMSVFQGGWTIDHVQGICREGDALTTLPTLVDKSLVMAEPLDKGMRYSFLETIRQYARDRLLDSGHADQTRKHHLDYFERYSKTETDWEISDYVLYNQRMAPEVDNFRAALTWGLENNPAPALGLVVHLTNFWMDAGLVKEGLDWLNKLGGLLEIEELETAAPALALEIQAGYHLARTAMLLRLGHPQPAFKSAKLADRLVRSSLDAHLRVRVLTLVAMAGMNIGNVEEAQLAIREGLALSQKGGMDIWAGTLMLVKGQMKMLVDKDPKAARTLIEEALSTYPDLRATTIGVRPLIALEMLGGNLERARELVREELHKFDEMKLDNNSRYFSLHHATLGHIERKLGNLDAAVRIYAGALPIYLEMSMEPTAIHLLECFAMIAVEQGRHTRGSRLFGAAEALREHIQITMRPDEQFEHTAFVTRLKDQLSVEVLEAEWRGGSALSLEEAADFALQIG